MERAESSPIGVLPLRIRIDGQFVLILTQESEDCVQHGTTDPATCALFKL
jgi:hypothetical protein